MIPKKSSIRYTNRVVWFSVYTTFDVIMFVRKKELDATRIKLVQGISDPQSLSLLIVIFLILSILFFSVLYQLISVAVIKHYDQRQLKEERVPEGQEFNSNRQ